jgi:Tat protein secretion system quality control protein TatD with DNase activity
LIASKVSTLYDISEAQVAEITTANAAAIFKI